MEQWQSKYLAILIGGALLLVVATVSFRPENRAGPPPEEGFSRERAEYKPDAPPFDPARKVVSLEVFDPVDSPAKQSLQGLSTRIRVSTPFAFAGRLKLPDDRSVFGTILVRWKLPPHKGRPVIGQSGGAIPVRNSDGHWDYLVEMMAPKKAGAYDVEVVFIDATKKPAIYHVIGRSEGAVYVDDR